MPIAIQLPALSPTMSEGRITKWLKKEGDKVATGDGIAECETDKSNLEIEATDGGTLLKIVVPAGSTTPVGGVIGFGNSPAITRSARRSPSSANASWNAALCHSASAIASRSSTPSSSTRPGGSVVSPGPKDRAVDEGWPTDGIPTAYYSRHKAETERRLDRLVRERPDIRCVRLRPALIFKRDAGSGIRRLFLGPLLPSPLLLGSNWFPTNQGR